MIDDDSLYSFARSCANAYCRKFGAPSQFDDATQEACLYLLERRDKWTLEARFLKRRVVFELVRRYQNEHGLRRTNMLKRVDLDVGRLSERNRDDAKAQEARATIDETIRNGGLELDREIVELIVDGWTRKEIAKRYGVPFREISEIYKRFLRELRKLSDVSDEERKKYPLLYCQEDQTRKGDENVCQ